MNNFKNRLNEEEINFFQIVEKIFDEKKLIVSTVIVFFIFSSLYVYIDNPNKNKFIADIRVTPLSDTTTIEFSVINQLIEESYYLRTNPNYSNGNDLSSNVFSLQNNLAPVNSGFFFSKFLTELQKRNILKNTFIDYLNLDKINDPNFQKLQNIGWSFANKTKIKVTKDKSTSQTNFNMSFEVKDKQTALKIIKNSFDKINQIIAIDTLKFLDKIRFMNKLKIDTIEDKLLTKIKENAELENQINLKNIKFIKQQIKIANSLNIVENEFDERYPNLTESVTNKIYEDPLLELTYFYKGSKLLNHYLGIYENKVKNKDIKSSKEISKLETELRFLKNIDLNLRMKNAVKMTSLKDDDFKSVFYELNNIKYLPLPSGNKIVVFFTFFGLILSIIFILIKNSFNNYLLNKNDN